jgi:hypothetical protein
MYTLRTQTMLTNKKHTGAVIKEKIDIVKNQVWRTSCA